MVAPRPIETTAPDGHTAVVACTADPGEFSGSHTTRSGMSVISSGKVISPRVGGDGHRISPSARRSRRRSSPTAARPAARAVPARCGSPSCSRPSSSSIRQPVSTASPLPGCGGASAADARARSAACRPTSPSRASSSPAAAASGRPRSTPISSAERVQHPQIGRGVASRSDGSNGRIRPSQLTNEPRLLDDGRDREHHVGEVGDRAVAQLEADDERRGVDRGQRGVGVGQVGEVDAADQQRTQFAGGRRGENARGVAAGGVGQRRSTFQAAAVCARAAASATGRPPGSRFGSAPASSAPRSPARRGTQPSRAPVAAANLLAAESAPGESPAARRPG